ncbi:amidase [Paenibacillus crassostreae]|uniref:Amidase n=1 Tax=Paenibacillus crassostreae TaxID=1763538 RepID=A0A162KQ47_9BACL|nr:amidase [Paenibacillus crassostreae]AOZ94716.1 amidase [Paenibacillus crassostreae]OAB72073.1 amidase [Paenibacillus crassostreae]
MDNRYGAFITPELNVMPMRRGYLDGLVFAVKDVFAITDHRSSAGNPDWLRSHEASSYHADVVTKLLLAGASLRGVTHTDELMYSLGGENYHYGTPTNPRAPGRIPGGSSSGSAVAVASGGVDFALGTDTGGSIRVPSSYCGVFGFRPTYGAIGMDGVIPLSPSFDTVGWMADKAELLYKVGKVLLESGNSENENSVVVSRSQSFRKSMERIVIPTDAWALAGKGSSESLYNALAILQQDVTSTTEIVELAPEGLKKWMDAFRELQGDEIWTTHGEWIQREHPQFGSDIAERFTWASQQQGKDHTSARALRAEVTSQLRRMLGQSSCIVIPTVPEAAPLCGGDDRQLEMNRSGAMKLCCIAGLAGLPQVTVPITGEHGLPLGLSIIGGHGQDLRLLSWIKEIWK